MRGQQFGWPLYVGTCQRLRRWPIAPYGSQMHSTSTRRFAFIRRRCAHLSEVELQAAEARFTRYLEIVAEIVEREARRDSTESASAPHTEERSPPQV